MSEANLPEEGSGGSGEQAKEVDPEQFLFKDRQTCVKNIDDLYSRYSQGYYHTLEALQDDF